MKYMLICVLLCVVAILACDAVKLVFVQHAMTRHNKVVEENERCKALFATMQPRNDLLIAKESGL